MSSEIIMTKIFLRKTIFFMEKIMETITFAVKDVFFIYFVEIFWRNCKQ